MSQSEPAVTIYLNQLSGLMQTKFSREELIQIAFRLGLSHEDIPSETRPQFTRELVTYFQHTGHLLDLLEELKRDRPTVTWPPIPEPVFLAGLSADTLMQYAAQLDDVPEPAAALPPGSRLPLARNPLFTGRLPDLESLAHAIFGNPAQGGVVITQNIPPNAAITGLGGIGKSQLAVEFAYRYGRYFPGGVFWLSFADPAAIEAEIIACGGVDGLNLPGFASLDFPDKVKRTRAAWHDPISRLLIFDNCEDPDLLDQYRPPSGGCRLLLTSRNQEWETSLGIQPHRLGTLPRSQSITLLQRHLATLAEDDANAIADELGDLPLALHLAGSYLATYRAAVTPAAFLVELRAAALAHPALQGKGGRHSPTRHERSLERTFELSYARLRAAEQPEDPLALTLLYRAAYLAPGEPIPRDLLLVLVPGEEVAFEDVTHPASKDAGLLEFTGLLEFEDALRRLAGLGLLEMAGDDTSRLHRLLAHFVRAADSDTAETQQAFEQAVIKKVYQLNTAGYPLRLLPWLPHLRHLAAEAAGRADETVATLDANLGFLLRSQGEYAGARPYYERALSIRERMLGPEHPDTAQSLNYLGALLRSQGDYAGARLYFERALSIRERALGPDHPDTAQSLKNLGLLLHNQGEYAAARPYYEQALSIRERVLGPDHPDTAQSLNNLGYLLRSQGDYAGARPYCEQALSIYERVLGPDHPDTALSLNNLGLVLQNQSDYAEAWLYFKRALSIYERVLGPDHPDTADSLNHLGYLLDRLGDYTAARPYYERALSILERSLGPNHPHTQTVRNNLVALPPAP